MKRFLLLVYVLSAVFLLSSCKTSNEDLNLIITGSHWYLEQDEFDFNYIKLEISGYTTGERVTVMTFGDGIYNEKELLLDDENHFMEIVTISFSYEGYTPPMQADTTVRAYRGSEYVELKLESGDIWE